jgi:hypothetical protein
MANKVMLILLAVVSSFSLPSLSTAQSSTNQQYAVTPDAYRNLPGVKDPATLPPDKERYTCHTALSVSRYPDRAYRDLYDYELPVLGYRCQNGPITYFGTENPTSKKWYPGINPRNLD